MTKPQPTESEQTRAILVGLQTNESDDAFARTMEELSLLADTAGINVAATLTQKADRPVQSTYIGSGKVEELRLTIEATEATLVIFDEMLSPTQFRNLHKECKAEILDRTGLILQIFSEQARTREARLQVEYAQLQYVMPRLVGMWTHFGRQGGTGGHANRGVGETQLELDRRHIERRMSELRKALSSIEKERATQRGRRQDAGLPKVALVGYTNAGKSTLMNELLRHTGNADETKQVYEKDELFATLDSSIRKITPAGMPPFLLSDTVGFIQNLPTQLVKAFRSTLDEVRYADLLLQVVDYADPDYRTCMHVTNETLREIEASHIPMITIFNKADKKDAAGELAFAIPAVRDRNIYMSAKTGTGIDELLVLIRDVLQEDFTEEEFLLPYDRGDLLARLRERATILSENYREDGILVTAKCAKREKELLQQTLS